MSSTSRIDIRLSEEEKQQAQVQASKFGLSVSDYIRMLINLDIMTNIVQRIKDDEHG
jgi:antitoxin component of RelBE/YafQ-DinJ toxin-antitoxin module